MNMISQSSELDKSLFRRHTTIDVVKMMVDDVAEKQIVYA